MCSGSRGDASLPSTLTSMRYNATCFTICVQKTLKARITRHKMGDRSRNGGEKNAPPRANLAPGTRLMVFYVSEHSWTFGENTLKRRQTTLQECWWEIVLNVFFFTRKVQQKSSLTSCSVILIRNWISVSNLLKPLNNPVCIGLRRYPPGSCCCHFS